MMMSSRYPIAKLHPFSTSFISFWKYAGACVSQMELCWTDIYRGMIKQQLISALLIRLIQCGSILTWAQDLKKPCSPWVWHTVRRSWGVAWVICILFHCLLLWPLVGVCWFSCNLCTFSFWGLLLVCFSLEWSLLVMPKARCFFL